MLFEDTFFLLFVFLRAEMHQSASEICVEYKQITSS
jgi:hypothetical protein